MEKTKEGLVKLLIFIIFLLVIAFGVTVFFLLQKNNTNENVQQIAPIVKTDEEVFIDYLLDSVEKYASKEILLKSLDGNISAPKLTEAEAKNNRNTYALILKGIINDETMVISSYEKQDKKYFVYNIKEVLNKLGVSAHMGIGINADSRGMKLYFVGQNVEDTIKSTDEGWITSITNEFGYNKEEFTEYILDSIEKYASKSVIIKSVDGNITAPKLTLLEAKTNRESYKQIINTMISEGNRDIFVEMYLENKTLNCKYNFEPILNALDIGTHMGIGIEISIEGSKTFSWQ